jgi:quercetin dioxygenase-like cupin family protein
MATTTIETERDEIRVGGERVSFTVPSEASGGEVAVFDVTLPPGGGPPMLHRHDPFEAYRVTRGELTFYVEGEDGRVERSVAGAGTVVPIAPGVEHTVRNESEESAEAIVVFAPGEPMESFARAAGELGRGSAPSLEELIALAAEHGIEITRPIEEALSEAAGGRDSVRILESGYLSIARFRGDGGQLLGAYREYNAVMSGVGADHGLIAHVGAKTEDGFVVVNLWPARENSEAAAADPRRLAVLERVATAAGGVSREHHEVERAEIHD